MLVISAEYEQPHQAATEGDAALAHFQMKCENNIFTANINQEDRFLYDSSLISTYPLAMWLAWYWWRLQWEPRPAKHKLSSDWKMAHNLRSVGEGFVWPDVTIVPDGSQLAIINRPTDNSSIEPIQYIGQSRTHNISVQNFRSEVENLVSSALDVVEGCGFRESDLRNIWNDVKVEWENAELSLYRKFEAAMGFDPDDAPEELIDRVLNQVGLYGESAYYELSVLNGENGDIPTGDELQKTAERIGYDGSLNDIVRLDSANALPPYGDDVAWRRAVQAARALREQENLGASPVDDQTLTQMMGVSNRLIQEENLQRDFAFAIRKGSEKYSFVPHSKIRGNRRFDVARALADYVAGPDDHELVPATTSYTYRQKFQRAFAAEFLCPIKGADEMADGDYSDESQETISEYYDVSSLMVNSLLKNNKRLPREESMDVI